MTILRNGILAALSLAFLFVFAAASLAEDSKLSQVESKTLDKEDFVFPDDLNAARLDIVLLAIGEDQDNGTWQGEELLKWYAALDEQGLLSEEVKAWHFSVMKVPFFVKSLIRNGMADQYAGKVPMNQSAPLYVKDVQGFATAAGLQVDGQPSVVLVSPETEILQSFKGEATAENVAAVAAAVKARTGDPAAPTE